MPWQKVAGFPNRRFAIGVDGISEPKATQIAKISKFLNVSSDYLLGLSDI